MCRIFNDEVIKITSPNAFSLAIGELLNDKLYNQFNNHKSNLLTLSISRKITIDMDCCRLPKASIITNKADRSRSDAL